ncbi:hypothetical protein BDV95DRAFT_606360 [Massariosphaeria phaeospora]|uniref:Uncharacterized protein n=1 Tax=Massariosphaeria phaeospora TaxID=100035 RepID=A0A7C8I7T3_9PLEO|nr:hypothetical protein BDV95DRAFT_606360 [Massariosphaeria phaeospora]
MQSHRGLIDLLLTLIQPNGAFPLLIRSYKKKFRFTRDGNKQTLKYFLPAFDSDLHTLYLDLHAYKTATHSAILPDSVLELLDCLNQFVSAGDEEDRDEEYGRLKRLRTTYSENNEPLLLATAQLQVEDHHLTESILERLELSIVSLEETTGTDQACDFGATTIFREEPNFGNWHVNTKAIQALTQSCCCDTCDCPIVRLALATNRKLAGELTLELLLALDQDAHPWREIVLSMEDQQKAPRQSKVHFGDDSSSKVVNKMSTKDFVAVKTLCKQIQEPASRLRRLEWHVKGHDIWQKKRRCPNTYSAEDLDDVVPLTNLLSRYLTVNHRIKTILAVILGHSLLQLYNTPWLQYWSREHIVFIRKGNTLPMKPFLLTGPLRGAPADETDSCHPYPSILALGTILLELELHQPLDGYTNTHGRDPMTVAYEVFQKERRNMLKDYSKAIEACLDANFGYDEDYEEGSEDFRRLIYERIVRPLEDQLEIAFSDKVDNIDAMAPTIDLSEFRGMSYPNETAPNTVGHRSKTQSPVPLAVSDISNFRRQEGFHEARAQPAGLLRPGSPTRWRSGSPLARIRSDSSVPRSPPALTSFKLFDDHFDSSSQENGDVTDAWFKNLQPVKQILHQESPSSVKIAILDTGIDLEHQDMFAVADRIKDIRNWANGANGTAIPKGGDSHGHGTHVAGIVLDVAELADVYIAKITDNGNLDDMEAVAQAITFAATQWKVDIITMSFGFPDRAGIIESAIREANCLMFAAAANHGGNYDRAYPAKHDGVICIHSTDGRGKASGFNPPPLRPSDNFSIVGEAIYSAWPGDDEFKRKSGTSFATPVAAGLAAFVLEYGMQNLQDEPEKLQRLMTCEGMKDVLRLMAVEVGGYQYLRPWELFNRKKKDWTRTIILEALK